MNLESRIHLVFWYAIITLLLLVDTFGEGDRNLIALSQRVIAINISPFYPDVKTRIK